jgi:hypothetical protein
VVLGDPVAAVAELVGHLREPARRGDRVTGEILVIEWERGTNDWRETLVRTGQTYTIDLVGRENGAMLETPNNTEPFTASFASCTPQPIPAE